MLDSPFCNCVNQCPQCGTCCRFSCEHRNFNYQKVNINLDGTWIVPEDKSYTINIGWICSKCKNSINPKLSSCPMCSTFRSK